MMSQRINGVSPQDAESARRTAANAISEDVILDAATRLMSTIGIRRTTMAAVARAAGVSRATLYRRFPNVESLAAQVTTREFTKVAASAPVQGGLETRQAMIVTLTHLVREARRHPLLQRIIELDPEFLVPYLLHRTGRTSRNQLESLETVITAGQRDGEIRDGSPSRIAATVLQTAWSFTFTGPVFIGPDATDPDATDTLDEEFADLLERYLRP